MQSDLFQKVDGGAIPTSPLQIKIRECKFSDIRVIFEKFHYKGGHMGGGISWCLAGYFNSSIVAGLVIGKPRHEKKYSDNGPVVEIRRMACLDEMPKNTESYLLSKCIWWLKKNTSIKKVVSYADKSVGHVGTIYKAANFKLIGQTQESVHVFWHGKRYHPRSLTIDRPYSYKMRQGLNTGETTVIKGEPKNIYEYQIK